MKRSESPEPVTVIEAIMPVASLIVPVGLSYYLFGDADASGPNQVGLVAATMIAVFIGWRRGHSLASLGEAAVDHSDCVCGASGRGVFPPRRPKLQLEPLRHLAINEGRWRTI
ncbi:hypothetical protein B0G69_7041 [Paraburkholderia sp. RAU2J]|uniref:hypothetical protein n=1 Tax=Paraburkholderia sp. RAU2J TaxID=1938810 RepID=UPI000F121392|nr:hypothetical protein [Paraburkholderia sp. RAU2J]RKT13833.1 hypothetical protein B0G69_7041 [Paraburkholderia sp. RAU2J]